jgi:hypothetical protein
MRKLFFISFALLIFLCYSKAVTKSGYDSSQVRIDSLRKGNFILKIVNNNGDGVIDSIKIIQKKLEFPWGTAIDLNYNADNVYTSAQTIIPKSDSEIYRTERWASYLAYLLPSEKGKKYKRTIKMAENYFDAANSRIFDVFIYGNKIMQNIDKYALAKDKFKTKDKTVTVVVLDTLIRLEFQATKDKA